MWETQFIHRGIPDTNFDTYDFTAILEVPDSITRFGFMNRELTLLFFSIFNVYVHLYLGRFRNIAVAISFLQGCYQLPASPAAFSPQKKHDSLQNFVKHCTTPRFWMILDIP